MSEKIFIGAAWPYANGPLHLGHIAGAYLPADIFARYHRIKGNEVLMVSGSDQHGTPITIRAEQEKTTPEVVAEKYHREFRECWEKLGISFDLFTNTSTKNHEEVTHDIFRTLQERDLIYKSSSVQPYCPKCERFMPDRYIEGVCPYCHTPGARGDQCDACGKPLNAAELLEPRCRLCGTTPVFKETEHFFFRLSAFQNKLLQWIKDKTYWRANVLNFTTRYLEDGLKDRPITRDIEWGIPVPVEGFEHKRIYVWFEAVIGYLSASKEWAKTSGDAEKWRSFWQGEAKDYYFIGKDNIPFHTIIWPAMLMGYGGLNLPYDVVANEFLNLESKKFSTSKNWAVWVPDYLTRFEPDPLRYLLSINMPETSDTDFSWYEFVRRNNDELVATYGNLVHRVLSFTYKNFEGKIPTPAELDKQSQDLLALAKDTLAKIDQSLHDCHFAQAIKMGMALAQQANRYLDDKSPWKAIKQDREAAATSLYTAIGVIFCLRTALYPFLPFSSQKLHQMLGFGGDISNSKWEFSLPPAGQAMQLPAPLFIKFDDKVAEEEVKRLGT